tara:strand:- start:1799 stop:2116 length:318 start_codon:yes stop_codon:yes gene_type:complete
MKGKILDSAIKLVKPSTVLELGTYLGYSAVRIGRLLPAGSRLYTLEKFAANVDIARKIIEIAGLSGKVKVRKDYFDEIFWRYYFLNLFSRLFMGTLETAVKQSPF